MGYLVHSKCSEVFGFLYPLLRTALGFHDRLSLGARTAPAQGQGAPSPAEQRSECGQGQLPTHSTVPTTLPCGEDPRTVLAGPRAPCSLVHARRRQARAGPAEGKEQRQTNRSSRALGRGPRSLQSFSRSPLFASHKTPKGRSETRDQALAGQGAETQPRAPGSQTRPCVSAGRPPARAGAGNLRVRRLRGIPV